MLGLILLLDGLFVVEVVGVALGLDAGLSAAEAAVSDYGRKIENRTRAVCDEQAAREVALTSQVINKKWSSATVELQTRHEAELAASTASVAGDVVSQLVQAGWRPPTE